MAAPETELPSMHVGLQVAVNVTALVLTTACVGLRLYVRYKITRSAGYDDYILIAAQILFIMYIAFFFSFFIYDVKNHIVADETDLTLFWNSVGLTAIHGLFWSSSLSACKCALAAFFFRVVPRADHMALRWFMIIFTGIITLFVLAAQSISTFQRGNPFTLGNGPDVSFISPDDSRKMSDAARAVLIASDWITTLIPAYVVAKSSMPLRSKLPTIGIIMLGTCASVLCILRYHFENIKEVHDQTDFAHYFLYQTLAMSENCVGLIVISLAATKPLFAKLLKGRTIRNANGNNGNANQQEPCSNTIVFLTDFKIETETDKIA